MSTQYSVIPLNNDVIEWLASEGVMVSVQVDSRYPTISEIRTVLDHKENWKVMYSQDRTWWYANIEAVRDEGETRFALIV